MLFEILRRKQIATSDADKKSVREKAYTSFFLEVTLVLMLIRPKVRSTHMLLLLYPPLCHHN
jgi:hypothetical protein